MSYLDNFRKLELRRLKEDIERAKNSTTLNDEQKAQMIGEYEKAIENFDEWVNLYLKATIRQMVETYSKEPNSINAAHFWGFESDAQLLERIKASLTSVFPPNLLHPIFQYGDGYYEKKVQEIYELVGFHDHIPTNKEVLDLEIKLNLAVNEGKSKGEILELEKELELMKLAHGPYYIKRYTFPMEYSKDIKARFDKMKANINSEENKNVK